MAVRPSAGMSPGGVLVGVVLLAVLGLVAAACGSSSSHSTTAATGSALVQECTNIGDVLSDGPDPSSDPVGYAEAQVLPLKQLKLTNSTLRQEVQRLATAYKEFSSTNGKDTAAAVKVSQAESKLGSQCPKGIGAQPLPGQTVP
jgi:hypothetical protein